VDRHTGEITHHPVSSWPYSGPATKLTRKHFLRRSWPTG
jgi:hypothetical protein